MVDPVDCDLGLVAALKEISFVLTYPAPSTVLGTNRQSQLKLTA